MCFMLDKPAKKYFMGKDEECYRTGNIHSEFDTWRSSKLVCSTGKGHKAGKSLAFNLDLGWRSWDKAQFSFEPGFRMGIL